MTQLEKLNQLPEVTRNEVKEILTAYEECNVIFENGAYQVSPDISIKSKYAKDYKWIGTFKAKEIFTKEERKSNFKKVFGYEYRGEIEGL